MCVCVCVCVRACVCVCVCVFMWFMRTQICIWHGYDKEKVIYEDIYEKILFVQYKTITPMESPC